MTDRLTNKDTECIERQLTLAFVTLDAPVQRSQSIVCTLSWSQHQRCCGRCETCGRAMSKVQSHMSAGVPALSPSSLSEVTLPPPRLPTYTPTYLPTYLPAYTPTYLPCLHTYLPIHLSMWQLTWVR